MPGFEKATADALAEVYRRFVHGYGSGWARDNARYFEEAGYKVVPAVDPLRPCWRCDHPELMHESPRDPTSRCHRNFCSCPEYEAEDD